MILYDYFRSSAAYRVRIALHLKGLAYTSRTVELLQGEERGAEYRAINPQGLVPALALDDGTLLCQSLAICDYLEETCPEPPLLPADPVGRARVRSLAQAVACEMHPVNSLRVLNYLDGTLGVDAARRHDWYRYWIAEGFRGIEAQLCQPGTGRFCHGDTPTLADVYLVPQVFNARHFECDLAPYPTLTAIAERCDALPAFAAAHPSRQPGAV
jgi:maleylacetoacetate isomerase